MRGYLRAAVEVRSGLGRGRWSRSLVGKRRGDVVVELLMSVRSLVVEVEAGNTWLFPYHRSNFDSCVRDVQMHPLRMGHRGYLLEVEVEYH